jgi:hypothetical protein
MASKGLTKRHSARQKEHYAAHRFKLEANKLARLKRHIRRNAREVAKKARRKLPRLIRIDKQAVNRLKALS